MSRRDLLAGASASAAMAMTSTLAAAPTENTKAISPAPRTCVSLNAPLRDLHGKVAFITGGSSGIGLGIARACVGSGMKVVITYRSKEHLDAALKSLPQDRNRVHAIKVDVTDTRALHDAAEESVETYGKVHLLVNNAGVQNSSPLSKISRPDWDLLMNVNVGGVLNCVQTFLPYLTTHREGAHIAATSSIMGLFTTGGGYAAYCASKFAVVAMMETLRSELAEARVGVSLLCPGLVKSNLEKGLTEHPAASDPLEVGKRLLEGVRRNELYVLTHPEFAPIIRKRFELIEGSLNHDLPVSEGRRSLAETSLATSIYTRDLADSAC